MPSNDGDRPATPPQDTVLRDELTQRVVDNDWKLAAKYGWTTD